MIDKFLNMEKKYNLFNRKINKFSYWPYVRFDIYMKLKELEVDKKNKKTSPITFDKFIRSLKTVVSGKCRNYPADKNILIFNHPRKIKNGEYYECMYTEEISKYYNSDTITLEFPEMFDHYSPIFNDNIKYLDQIELISHGMTQIYRKLGSNKKFLKEVNFLTDLITNELKTEISPDYLLNLIKKRYSIYKTKFKMLKKIIKKISPKIIIETVSYDTNKLIVNELASELNIPTIELQHGVMGRGHIAYNFNSKKHFNFFPDYLFLFSEFWEKNTKLPISENNVKIVGFPYLEKNINFYPPKNKRESEENKKRIIILSQPEFSDKVLRLTLNLVNQLNENNSSYYIIYKLHPSESNKKEFIKSEFINDNVKIISNNDYPIYKYFSEVDIQIGVTSTAIYEGLAYNLQTYIYHIEKTDSYMFPLVDNDLATFFDNSSQLIKIMDENKFSANNKKLENNYFWPQHSFTTMIQYIDEIYKYN